MKQLVVALIAFFAMIGSASAQVDQKQMQSDMIAPVVRITVNDGAETGSGTIIFSGPRNGRNYTFVLTNEHVIDAAVKAMIKKKLGVAKNGGDANKDDDDSVDISVERFVYNAKGVLIATTRMPAQLGAFDKGLDLAIVVLADDVNTFPTVTIAKDDTVNVFDKVFAVGSGLGGPTFVTDGIISQTDSELGGHRFLQSSAPIIMGNSGGGLFRFEAASGHYELIGVPSAVAAYGRGAVNPNMGWSIPAETVREFLKEVHLGSIVGPVSASPEPSPSDEPPATNFPGIEHP